MKHTQKNLAVLGTIGIAGVMLAGCGGSPSAPPAAADGSVYDQFADLPDAERHDALVAAAEKEGTVTAYLRSDDVFADIEAAFEAEYNVDLVILNPGTTQVVQQQIFEQFAAQRVEADVVETYTHELNLMYAEENVVAPIPEYLAAAAPQPEFASAHSIETFQYPFLPTWNSDKVTGADIPTSLSDFADPVWKDNTVLVTNYHPWYLTIFQQLTENEGMSVDDFEKLMKQIAANSSKADSSNPASASIASGEYLGGPNIAMVAPQRLGDSAPIAYIPTMDPAPLVPAGIGLINGSAHPAAALLFAEWYINAGSDILAEEQYVEQNATETDLLEVSKVRPHLDDLTTERLNDWRVAYDNLLKGKDPVLPDYVRGN